jgi:L-lactate dehydrogenase complex protein LldG
MEESTSREKVLKSVRDALVNQMQPPYVDEDYADHIYQRSDSDYEEVVFAEALAKVGGQFVYNSTHEEFSENIKNFMHSGNIQSLHCYDGILQNLLNESGIFCINSPDEPESCEAGITSCEFLIARLGSIMVSSKQPSGRKSFFWPPVHIVVAFRDQLVYDIKQALTGMKVKYQQSGLPSLITMITGPSRTADIEKTLVMGAHGPEKLIVFFIDQPLKQQDDNT